MDHHVRFAVPLVFVLTACGAPPAETIFDADGSVTAFFSDSFSARFYDGPPQYTGRHEEGACVVVRPTTAPVRESAGEVRVSGLSECTDSPDASLEYYCLGTGPLYAPGTVVTVEAAGATFPAFRTQVTAPSFGTGVQAEELADGSLLLSWTGGSGRAYVLAGASTAATAIAIECAVDTTEGSITIPASVLSELAAVSETAPLNLTFEERRWVEVDGRRVLVQVGFFAGTY
jgi:hypothetical protein